MINLYPRPGLGRAQEEKNLGHCPHCNAKNQVALYKSQKCGNTLANREFDMALIHI